MMMRHATKAFTATAVRAAAPRGLAVRALATAPARVGLDYGEPASVADPTPLSSNETSTKLAEMPFTGDVR